MPQNEVVLEHALCCVCQIDIAEPVGVGEDFEFRLCRDNFLAVRCQQCGVVYLNPRPSAAELQRLYVNLIPAYSHAPDKTGLLDLVCRKIAARSLLKLCRRLPNDAKILDVGCGTGTQLRLLRDFGNKTWSLEGVDTDPRVGREVSSPEFTIHMGPLEDLALPTDRYQLILMTKIIEHLHNPAETLQAAVRLLAPRGRLVIVTDNTRSFDFRIFGGRHWGGYRFPRHVYLFDRKNLAQFVTSFGLDVESMRSKLDCENGVRSFKNWVDDWGGPRWLVNRISVQSPIARASAIMFDFIGNLFGGGAMVQGIFRKPVSCRRPEMIGKPAEADGMK